MANLNTFKHDKRQKINHTLYLRSVHIDETHSSSVPLEYYRFTWKPVQCKHYHFVGPVYVLITYCNLLLNARVNFLQIILISFSVCSFVMFLKLLWLFPVQFQWICKCGVLLIFSFYLHVRHFVSNFMWWMLL